MRAECPVELQGLQTAVFKPGEAAATGLRSSTAGAAASGHEFDAAARDIANFLQYGGTGGLVRD